MERAVKLPFLTHFNNHWQPINYIYYYTTRIVEASIFSLRYNFDSKKGIFHEAVTRFHKPNNTDPIRIDILFSFFGFSFFFPNNKKRLNVLPRNAESRAKVNEKSTRNTIYVEWRVFACNHVTDNQ